MLGMRMRMDSERIPTIAEIAMGRGRLKVERRWAGILAGLLYGRDGDLRRGKGGTRTAHKGLVLHWTNLRHK